MTKIVFVTQTVDSADPALGATAAMVRELALRVDEVVVLALRGSPTAPQPNVRVRIFGGGTRAGRTIRLLALLSREVADRPAAVVAHMSPIYAILAVPLARPRRVPVLLWFTHWRKTLRLRIAERASTAVLTVDTASFPFASRKVRAVGHGIDVEEFACVDRSGHTGPMRVLAVGRTSPSKGLPTIVEAVRRARERGVDLELELRGPSLTDEERRHREELGHVEPPVPRTEMPGVLARADVLVNNMRAGALDKVVFEACASCLPAVASNPGFAGLLGDELRFDRDSPDELADRLAWLAGLTAPERAALGRRLRERVERDHSVAHWAAAVVDAALQRA